MIDAYCGIRVDAERSKIDTALAELRTSGYAEKRGNLWYLAPAEFKTARGNSRAPQFEEMDFWIAFAIAGIGVDCELIRLIGMLDFVVRTLPSYDEIYGGINRLVAAGLMTHRRGVFSPTEQSTQLLAKAKTLAKKDMYDQFDSFKRLTLCPCCGATLKRVRWNVPITEDEFARVIQEHQDEF